MTEQTEEKTEEKTQVDVGAIEERARRFEAQLIDANKRLEKFAGIDVEKYHAVLEDYDNLRKEKATGSREEIDALIEDKRKEIEGAYKTHLDEAKNKSLTVVEDFDFDTPKTKSFTAVLDALGVSDKKSLLVLGAASKNVYMSARNLQRTEVVTDAELSTYKIVNAQHLILAESAVNSINSNLNTK